VSWADANLNEDRTDLLAHRLAEFEESINVQLAELRNEVGLATASMRSGTAAGERASMFGDLEEQLANAVTVSLSAALEQIRESLTESIAGAVAQLAFRLETMISALPPPRPQWSSAALDEAAAAIQHSVLLTLSSFEETIVSRAEAATADVPALAHDVALVNQRIDELRSKLLG
jgi:hypothetical protein